LVAVFLLLNAAASQSAEMVKLSSSLWSDLRDMDFQGSNAYCLFFDGLAVLDLSNINSPSQVGQIELSDPGLKLATTSNYAYVASEDTSLYVLDIGDVACPQLTDGFKLPDLFTGIEARDNCVYGSAKSAGFLVVDVSDPSEAAVIGSCGVEGFQPLSFCLHGNLAYLCGIGGLRLINVLFPSFPYLFSSDTSAPSANRVFVAEEGETVYVFLSNPLQLSIMDVTNPSGIQSVSVFMPSSEIVDFAFSGKQAYLATGYQHLTVLDVAEKDSPEEIAALGLGEYASALFCFSDFVFVNDLFGPTRVVNVFNPHRPFVAGQWIIPGSPKDVALKDSLALVVCANSGLHILNVEDPSHPQLLGILALPYNNNDVDLEGNYAYVTALLTGIQVVDISTPSLPVMVSQYHPEGYTYGVEAEDGYAYLRNSGSQIQIVDVQNPLSPLPRGSIVTLGSPQETVVKGDYLYVADLDSGLTIVNVSNKDQPQVTASFPTPGDCTNLFWADSLIFLVCGDIGVEICDLSNPQAPESLGVYSIGQEIRDIFVEDDYAYIGLDDHTVQAVDISVPSDPILAASYGLLDNPGSLKVYDRDVYLCDNRSFKILRFVPDAKNLRFEAKQLNRMGRRSTVSPIAP
jgi:hypothetical protein